MTRIALVCLMVFVAVHAKTRQRCNVRNADFVFILDSSSSIWKPDYTRQLEFVNNVVNEFKIGSAHDESRVGVLTFSSKAHIQFYLNQYEDKQQLKNAISGIPYLTGNTNTADAIRLARDVMFKSQYGARADVDHIAIVITDGKSQKSKDTLREAELAKAAGIQIFAIGVGNKTSMDELTGIASSPAPRYLYSVGNYKALNSIVSSLATQTCEDIEETESPTTVFTTRPTTRTSPTTTTTDATTLSTTTTVEPPTTTDELPQGDEEELVRLCGGKPADIFFILDSSTSIWTEDFRKQLQFVKNVIRTFDIGPSSTRVGVTTFSDDVHPMIDFNQYSQKEELLRAVDRVSYQGGLTFTGDAIEDMIDRAFAPGSARSGVAHIGVVITDGESREQQKTADQARRAHDKGIYLFAIGVGKAVNEDELKAIATDPDSNYVYTVNSYDALDTLRLILAQKACETDVTPTPRPIKDEPTCKRRSSDLVFTLDSRRSSPYAVRSIITLIDNVIRDLEISLLRLRVGMLQDACLVNSGDIALSSEANNFRKQLNAIQYSNMAALLKRLRTDMYYYQNPNEKVAVLFVDDKLNQAADAAEEANLARRQGIEIFVVAVGNTYVEHEVNSLCSAPAATHIIRVPSYSKLLSIRQHLGDKICLPSLLKGAKYY